MIIQAGYILPESTFFDREDDQFCFCDAPERSAVTRGDSPRGVVKRCSRMPSRRLCLANPVDRHPLSTRTAVCMSVTASGELVSILPQHHLMRIASNDAHFRSVCFHTSRPLTLF